MVVKLSLGRMTSKIIQRKWGNGVVEIMTCNDCGCSFTDVDNEDYTDVFMTGFCCDCLERQHDE